MVVEAGSFQAETFFSSLDRHKTFMPNGGVIRLRQWHGLGQCSTSDSEAFAIESTVELR